MAENRKNINLGFRVTEDRQEELKVRSARRKQSIQRMLEQGLDLLLGTSPPEGHRPQFASENMGLHEKLERILNSGDIETINAVVPNIELFHGRLRQGLDLKAPTNFPALAPEENRIIEEFRKSSYEKRRRMLAFIAKPEDLSPELMPPRKRAGGKS